MCNKEITVLPATHTRTIPAFTPQSQGVIALWLVLILCLPTKGWPGSTDLGGWLHTEINVSHRELNPDTVTHPNTTRARRRLTSLIDTNALPLYARPPASQGGMFEADVLHPMCQWETKLMTEICRRRSIADPDSASYKVRTYNVHYRGGRTANR